MSGLHRTIGSVLLAVFLCVGVSVGPAFGEDSPPPVQTSSAVAVAPPAEVTTEPASTTTPTVPPSEVTTDPAPGTTVSEPTREPAVQPSAVPDVSEPQLRVDLRITAVFDRPAYGADDDITVHATVINAGSATADGVRVVSRGDLSSDYWPEFGYGGVRLEPGGSVAGTLHGRVTTTADTLSLVVTAVASGDDDSNPADNTVTITVPIAVVRGDLTGVVYGDADLDTVVDPGEEVTGVEVIATGGVPYAAYRTTTDQAGRFRFRELPRGVYSAQVDNDDDWIYQAVGVNVGDAATPDVTIRGVRQLNKVIAGSMSFDRATYRVGETADLTISLANSGPTLTGIIASWSTMGSTTYIDLGELREYGPGATLPAGTTRVFHVPVPVDGGSADSGYLRVQLMLFSREVDTGSILLSAVLRVPGATAPRVVGRLVMQTPGALKPQAGPPVPNTVVYLRDRFSGAVTARTTTDAEGRFEFTDVPVGWHIFGVVGPWRIYYGQDFFVYASHDPSQWLQYVFVVPGPDQADPGFPSSPPADPPAPAAGLPPAVATLAYTGANVTWLALGALLALAAGAGLVLGTRRRTT